MTTVLLDFYGTLAVAARPGDWFDAILVDRGHRLDPVINARWSVVAWDGATHHEHSADEASYQAWEDDRWTRLLTDHGIPTDEHGELIAALRHWRDAFEMVAYDESAAVLAELRDAGHTLVVCSNWDWDLDDHLRSTGLARLIDDRVSSAWVGSRKPHPLIYQRALELGGADPDRTVFVGDSWDADVEGPRRLGMTAVHVHRGGDPRPAHPLPDGVHRVTDLTGLPELVP
jgi:putative hydrolase of the HAD superfamily